jgi:hypothetical protein
MRISDVRPLTCARCDLVVSFHAGCGFLPYLERRSGKLYRCREAIDLPELDHGTNAIAFGESVERRASSALSKTSVNAL